MINSLSYGVLLMIAALVAFMIWGHTGDRRDPGSRPRKAKASSQKTPRRPD